jgi:putative ABC transport system permease protein
MVGLYLAVMSLVRRPLLLVVPALALAGCFIPILVMWSIKAGYVDGLMAQMESNPRVLEIRLRGDRTLSAEDIAGMRAIAGVGYLEPTTRGLAVRVFLGRTGDSRQIDATLLPSSKGDPLLMGVKPPNRVSVLISRDLAAQLGVQDRSDIEIRSARAGGDQILRIPVRVAAILDPASLSGRRLLVNPQVILDIEDFVDGYAVPAYGITGKPIEDRQRSFANARIYAGRLESVQPVAEALRRQGNEPETDEATVRFVLALQRATSFIVLTFAALLSGGAAITVWGALSQSLLPQRRVVGLFRLMGGTRFDVLSFVLVFLLAIIALSVGLTFGGYTLISSGINLSAADIAGGSAISLLRVDALLTAVTAVALFSLLLGLLFVRIYFGGTMKEALNHEG